MPLPLTQHVTNYELSKRLKAAGVKQQSYFCWQERDGKLEVVNAGFPEQAPIWKRSPSAFLASEFLENLPTTIEIEGRLGYFVLQRGLFFGKLKFCCLEDINTHETIHKEEAPTLPDAMGKMVVYLKENGLIEF